MARQRQVEETRDDGGNARVGDALLGSLKEEIDLIVAQSDKGVWDHRVDSQNTRFCIWEGQSADGRKHAAANDDEPVLPFEGACDQRVRLADMLVNEDVMLVVLATLRARLIVKPMEASDTQYAGKLQLLLNWILHNQLGFRFVRELIKLANYVMADSPAVALMQVVWRRETALALRGITVEEMEQLYMEQIASAVGEDEQNILEAAQAAIEEFRQALLDETWGTDEIAGTLLQFFPHLKPKRAAQVVKELRENGRAQFPVPYAKRNGPELEAKRLWEDWFVPANTTDFQRARVYFTREFLTRVEVRERQISEGWEESFVKKVIGDGDQDRGQEGFVAFKEYERNTDGQLQERDEEGYKGLYEIVTAHFQATNEDGIPGRYFVPLHYNVDEPAHEKRLLDYTHGNYAGHAFQREVLTKRLLDSRGLPELAASDQDIMKLLQDGYGDNAQLTAVPPIITRGRKSMGALYIEPLVELPAKRDGDYKWMQPPAYPATVVKMLETKRRDGNEFYGRSAPDVDEQLVELHKQFKATWWLANMAEVYRQTLQLAQQYMDDEQLQRITNQAGEPLVRNRDEIQGQFDVQISFDPRYMSVDFIEKLGGVMRDILLAIDKDQTIQTAPVVSALMWWVMPDLAQESLRSVDEANADELQQEIENYQKIRAGIEPPMADDGSQNYPLRLQMYQRMQEANPEIYSDLSPDKMAILETRLQHLQMMSEQYGENAQIGRQGVRAATGGGGEGMGEG